MEKRYNGFKNYETWLFATHYADFLYESYQDLKESNPDLDIDPVKFVKNFIEEILPSNLSGFFSDIIDAAVDSVDVERIAESLLED